MVRDIACTLCFVHLIFNHAIIVILPKDDRFVARWIVFQQCRKRLDDAVVIREALVYSYCAPPMGAAPTCLKIKLISISSCPSIPNMPEVSTQTNV